MSDSFDGEKILISIKNDAERARETPLIYFKEFLRSAWMDNTEDEAKMFWHSRVSHFPWYAENCLYAMYWVVKNPPVDIIDILYNDGWIILSHDDEAETPFTDLEYVDWLKKMYSEFKNIYDKAP
jgi:hypothetical protein